MIAGVRRIGRDRSTLEEKARDGQHQRDVTVRTNLKVSIAQLRRARVYGIDGDDFDAATPRLFHDRYEVHVRDVQVLAPVDQVARVVDVEEVVRLFFAEVHHLRRVAAARADVADLRRRRSVAIEEVRGEELHHSERAAAQIVEDRGGA